MKIALVVHRFGEEIAGGSEAHARGLAQELSRTNDVEVLTTCARDYLSWTNEFEPGETRVDGIRVTRFRNEAVRDLKTFAAQSELVFNNDHELADEERWIVENGPYCPGLVGAVSRRRDVDFFLCYSYRYYTAAHGARVAGVNARLKALKRGAELLDRIFDSTHIVNILSRFEPTKPCGDSFFDSHIFQVRDKFLKS